MNKPAYLSLSVLDLKKIVTWILVWLCETKLWWKCNTELYWCRQLHYSWRAEDRYKDIAEDVDERCDTSKFELGRLLRRGKNKKVIGLMKNQQKSFAKYFWNIQGFPENLDLK